MFQTVQVSKETHVDAGEMVAGEIDAFEARKTLEGVPMNATQSVTAQINPVN